MREVCKAGYLQLKSRPKPLKKAVCLPAKFVVFCVHDDKIPLLESYKNEKDMRNHEPESLVDMINCHYVTSALEDGRSFLIGLADVTLELVAQNEIEKNDWIHLLSYKLKEMNCLLPDTNPYVPLPRLLNNQTSSEPMPSLITIDSETDFGNNSASLSPQSSGTARAGSLGIRIPIIRRTTQPSATFTSSSSRVDTQSPVMISPTSPSNESNSGFGVSNAWNESGNTIDRSISEGGDSGSTVSHSGAEKPPPLPPRKQKGKSFDLHDSGIGRNPMDIDISPNVVVTGFSSPCANITPLTDDTGQPLYDALPRNEEIGSPANYDFFEPLPTISLTTVESSEPSTYSTLPRSGERRESGGRSPQCYDTLARLGRDFPTASAFATPSQDSSVLDQPIPLSSVQSPIDLYSHFSLKSHLSTQERLLSYSAPPEPVLVVDKTVNPSNDCTSNRKTQKSRAASVASTIQLDDCFSPEIVPLGSVLEESTDQRVFDWLENGSKPSEVFKTEVSTSSAFPDTPTVPPQLPIRKPVVRDRGRVEITQTESLPAAFEALTLESVPPVPPRNAVQGNLTLDNRSIRSLEVENLKKEVNTTEGLKVQLTYSDATKVAYVEIKGSIWVAGWLSSGNHKIKGVLHLGDRIVAINSQPLSSGVKRVEQILSGATTSNSMIDFVIRRMPMCQVYLLKWTNGNQNWGIVRDGRTSVISSVIGNEPADLAGLSAMTKGFLNDKEMVRWCITEINNQPISLSAKKNEAGHLLNSVLKEISIVVQPADFIKEIKRQLKSTKKKYEDFLLS